MDIIAYAAALAKANAYTDVKVSAIASGLHYKGSVATEQDLPSDAEQGDMYTTLDTGNEWVYDGNTWVNLGADIDELKEQVADLQTPHTVQLQLLDVDAWTTLSGHEPFIDYCDYSVDFSGYSSIYKIELINDNPAPIAKYGLVIGDVDEQNGTITMYRMKAFDDSEHFTLNIAIYGEEV